MCVASEFTSNPDSNEDENYDQIENGDQMENDDDAKSDQDEDGDGRSCLKPPSMSLYVNIALVEFLIAVFFM